MNRILCSFLFIWRNHTNEWDILPQSLAGWLDGYWLFGSYWKCKRWIRIVHMVHVSPWYMSFHIVYVIWHFSITYEASLLRILFQPLNFIPTLLFLTNFELLICAFAANFTQFVFCLRSAQSSLSWSLIILQLRSCLRWESHQWLYIIDT